MGSKDIKGWVCFIGIEQKLSFLCHRWQFAFGASARFSSARAGVDSCFIGVLLRGLIEDTEHRESMMKLLLGQTGQRFHLAIIADLQTHRRPPSRVFEESLPHFL
jgi:hypothetical protein